MYFIKFIIKMCRMLITGFVFLCRDGIPNSSNFLKICLANLFIYIYLVYRWPRILYSTLFCITNYIPLYSRYWLGLPKVPCSALCYFSLSFESCKLHRVQSRTFSHLYQIVLLLNQVDLTGIRQRSEIFDLFLPKQEKSII